jgi:hypothetical protein
MIGGTFPSECVVDDGDGAINAENVCANLRKTRGASPNIPSTPSARTMVESPRFALRRMDQAIQGNIESIRIASTRHR